MKYLEILVECQDLFIQFLYIKGNYEILIITLYILLNRGIRIMKDHYYSCNITAWLVI